MDANFYATRGHGAAHTPGPDHPDCAALFGSAALPYRRLDDSKGTLQVSGSWGGNPGGLLGGEEKVTWEKGGRFTRKDVGDSYGQGNRANRRSRGREWAPER